MFLVGQLSNATRRPPRNQRAPFLSRNDLRTVNFVTRETIRLLRRQGSQGQAPEVRISCPFLKIRRYSLLCFLSTGNY